MRFTITIFTCVVFADPSKANHAMPEGGQQEMLPLPGARFFDRILGRILPKCSNSNCKGGKTCCSGSCNTNDQCVNGDPPPTPPPTDPTQSPVSPSSPWPTFDTACPEPTYYPGILEVECEGLLLSRGLSCRRIAQSGEKVQYNDNIFGSSINFHDSPDAGACFATPDDGWIYTSNSEVSSGGGGVGTITFNADGQVTNYEMIATGTSRNCGGGRTSWGTWLSCEENGDLGRVFETFPDGSKEKVETKLGEPRGSFESVVQDENWCFYVTNDSNRGELRKYCPAQSVIDAAIASGDYSQVLTSEGGTMQYLVLSGNTATGSFSWSNNRKAGQNSAQKKGYPYSEGIDYRKGKIYFTSKTTKRLFILDLANQTFERHSTVRGAFNNQPDQVKFILGDNPDGILYFCEDGGSDCGVHGRDSQARFFSILDGPAYNTETTGLAFNPDATKMYVSFQGPGHIFEIWRNDGCPFTGDVLDIKYHEA